MEHSGLPCAIPFLQLHSPFAYDRVRKLTTSKERCDVSNWPASYDVTRHARYWESLVGARERTEGSNDDKLRHPCDLRCTVHDAHYT
jgi:hypothetical protein